MELDCSTNIKNSFIAENTLSSQEDYSPFRFYAAWQLIEQLSTINHTPLDKRNFNRSSNSENQKRAMDKIHEAWRQFNENTDVKIRLKKERYLDEAKLEKAASLLDEYFIMAKNKEPIKKFNDALTQLRDVTRDLNRQKTFLQHLISQIEQKYLLEFKHFFPEVHLITHRWESLSPCFHQALEKDCHFIYSEVLKIDKKTIENACNYIKNIFHHFKKERKDIENNSNLSDFNEDVINFNSLVLDEKRLKLLKSQIKNNLNVRIKKTLKALEQHFKTFASDDRLFSTHFHRNKGKDLRFSNKGVCLTYNVYENVNHLQITTLAKVVTKNEKTGKYNFGKYVHSYADRLFQRDENFTDLYLEMINNIVQKYPYLSFPKKNLIKAYQILVKAQNLMITSKVGEVDAKLLFCNQLIEMIEKSYQYKPKRILFPKLEMLMMPAYKISQMEILDYFYYHLLSTNKSFSKASKQCFKIFEEKLIEVENNIRNRNLSRSNANCRLMENIFSTLRENVYCEEFNDDETFIIEGGGIFDSRQKFSNIDLTRSETVELVRDFQLHQNSETESKSWKLKYERFASLERDTYHSIFIQLFKNDQVHKVLSKFFKDFEH